MSSSTALRLVGHVYASTSRRYAKRLPTPRQIYPVLDLVIDALAPEAEDVLGLVLRDRTGRDLPPWTVGSHLDLTLPSGRRRQYSLCGDPLDRSCYRIAVRRLPQGGGGSVEVHDALAAGDPLTVRGPLNAFPLVAASSYLLLAGGIGITPLLPMAEELARRGADWRLVYAGRSLTSMPFLGRVERLDSSRVLVRTGIVPTDELLAGSAQAAVFCCGPAPMLDAVQRAVRARGTGSVHVERFGAPEVVDGRPLEVTLARSGRTVQVAADTSVLNAVRRVLPDIGYSCQQGFCGTCEVRVLGGDVDHRDGRLTAEQRRGVMLPCVSRAVGEHLTLDL